MNRYKHNLRILPVLSATIGLSFGSAIVLPFFQANGLSVGQALWLQSVFSIAVVLSQVPTGYFADRFGRVRSIQAGQLFCGVGFLAYPFGHDFLTFAVAEVLIAIGAAFVFGASGALLFGSLKASGRYDAAGYRSYLSRMDSFAFLMTAIGAPLGSILAGRAGLRLPLFIDGCIAVAGFVLSLWLVESPAEETAEETLTGEARRNPIRAMLSVINYSVREHPTLPIWILLGSMLSAVTYYGFWLAPAWYEHLGIDLVWFGVILSARSIFKAVLAALQRQATHRFSDAQQLGIYIGLGLVAYTVAVVALTPWLLPFMLGFDIVQVLQKPLVSHRINDLVPTESVRVQVHSVFGMVNRLILALLSIVVGFASDRYGLQAAFIVAAAVTLGVSILCALALFRKRNSVMTA
jgi:MFS family permease